MIEQENRHSREMGDVGMCMTYQYVGEYCWGLHGSVGISAGTD